MDQTALQQGKRLLEREQKILIALPAFPSTDAVASASALAQFLEKQKKEVRVVSGSTSLSKHHRFLPRSGDVQSSLATGAKFVLRVDVSRTKVDALSYDVRDDTLNIFLTPKGGTLTAKDVTMGPGGYDFSLIVTLDAPTLESLGGIFDENTEFFYTTPILNIDHRAANTQYGHVNLVELTATATAEVVHALLRAMDEKLLDEHIATSLLAGVIAKTKSFQAGTVTPRALALAGELIEAGGRRDEIIRNLFQTKSLATLRLWGKVLSRLKTEAHERFLWSTLSRHEYDRPDEQHDELAGVIDDLIVDAPKAEIIAVLYETARGAVEALVHTAHTLNHGIVFRDFHPEQKNDLQRLRIAAPSLHEAEQRLLERVREHYSS